MTTRVEPGASSEGDVVDMRASWTEGTTMHTDRVMRSPMARRHTTTPSPRYHKSPDGPCPMVPPIHGLGGRDAVTPTVSSRMTPVSTAPAPTAAARRPARTGHARTHPLRDRDRAHSPNPREGDLRGGA